MEFKRFVPNFNGMFADDDSHDRLEALAEELGVGPSELPMRHIYVRRAELYGTPVLQIIEIAPTIGSTARVGAYVQSLANRGCSGRQIPIEEREIGTAYDKVIDHAQDLADAGMPLKEATKLASDNAKEVLEQAFASFAREIMERFS